ncbi:syncytin-1-like [Lissotriton helveticus]
MSTPMQDTWGYTFFPTQEKEVAISVTPRPGTLCLQGQGKIAIGTSLCNTTITYSNFTPYLSLPSGLHFVCGNKAYTWLPSDWSGTCYIAFLLPPTFNRNNLYHRQRRRVPDIDQTNTSNQQFGDALRGLLPFWGPMSNSLNTRRLTRVLEATAKTTAGILTQHTAEIDATQMVSLQNRMVLNVILADRGGACRIIGASYCVYIPDSSPSVYEAISKLHRTATEIHPDNGTPWTWTTSFWNILIAWGWKILVFLMIPLDTIFFCCLCIHCGPALCSMCTSICRSTPMTHQAETNKILYHQTFEELCNIDIY